MKNRFNIRLAKPDEAGLVLDFIKKLAEYEKCADEVVADEALLKHLANLAVERHCGRMEWICLDWNEPALKVYRSIGAAPMDKWTVQRLDEEALKRFAEK
jgi:hypothetical protein